jgi:hypothetical protein
MDDPGSILDDLGRDLFLAWLILHYFHKDLGDPAISELSHLTREIVQALASRALGNRGFNQETQTESMRALIAAAERFARANQSIAA